METRLKQKLESGNGYSKEQAKELRKFQDLAEQSYRNEIYTFTGFLDSAQIDVLLQHKKEMAYAGMKLYGGYENAERMIARFGSEEQLGYDMEFPISCLLISPLHPKYAEPITHRDCLGALMNLGVKREVLGDIIVGKNEALFFCMDSMAEYLCNELRTIRHTAVQLQKVASEMAEKYAPEYITDKLIISSNRVDTFIAGLYHLSRKQSLDLIKNKKVFVNHIQCEQSSYTMKENDWVSVRGYGKVQFLGEIGTTRKERTVVLYAKPVS